MPNLTKPKMLYSLSIRDKGLELFNEKNINIFCSTQFPFMKTETLHIKKL